MNTTKTAFAPSFGQLLAIDQVAEFLGVCRRTIYRELARGKFPKPVRIGQRSVRWKVADIEAYVNPPVSS